MNEGEGPRNVAVPSAADVTAVRCDKEEDLIFTVTIFGKSAVKFIYHIHDDTNTTKSSEISDYLSMQIF